MTNSNIQINGVVLGHVGWKYYNSIVKKAMEQEFSWSGLSISLSIAFFVVIFSAQALSMAYQSVAKAEAENKKINTRVYQMERVEIKSAVSGVSITQIT